MVKNLPAMQKTRVQSLGWEDPLEKGKASHFRILAWRIPWTEEAGELYIVHVIPESWTCLSNTFTFFFCKIPDQYSSGLLRL